MPLNIGYLTLRRIEKLTNVNNYIWQAILPYIRGTDILEIGAGVGVYTDFILKAGKNLLCVDIIPQAISAIKKKFEGRYPDFKALALDISDGTAVQAIGKRFDTVICLNVLEHIRDDEKAISNMARSLKSDGVLILLVPALKFLYGSLDKNLGHYRRYTYGEIKIKLVKQGFFVEKYFYLHFMGIFGWFIRSHLTKNVMLTKGDLEIYNLLVPFFRLIDCITSRLAGQSLVIIAKPAIA